MKRLRSSRMAEVMASLLSAIILLVAAGPSLRSVQQHQAAPYASWVRAHLTTSSDEALDAALYMASTADVTSLRKFLDAYAAETSSRAAADLLQQMESEGILMRYIQRFLLPLGGPLPDSRFFRAASQALTCAGGGCGLAVAALREWAGQAKKSLAGVASFQEHVVVLSLRTIWTAFPLGP